jgi:NAD(P)-dependent dehydrogenase (short-subunit alcohol dehydrogenase family)
VKIQDTTALVTGANRGIGKELVASLLGRGAKRVYAAARELVQLEGVVELDRARVVPIRMDIAKAQEVKAAAEKAHDVELLINNAGVAAFGSVLEGSLELITRDMGTNYFGTLNVLRAFVPVMERTGGGSIVNLLSVVALASMPALGGYSASKAALYSLTQALRAELAKKRIRVHAVFPGPVDTDMIRSIEMPKTSPSDVAVSLLDAVEADAEDIFPDPMSKQVQAAWVKEPKAIERQFGSMM